jgi:hypothetical protein
MTKTRQGERVMEQSGVKTAALPLAVLTVTIDGKRLTPAIYKQLAEEDVIDEATGELRGTPVGYFNIHPKEGCPKEAHKHVLWGRGTHLRMATIVARENDPRFAEKEQRSLRRRREIIHLLALLLAGADSPYTLQDEDEYQLDIAGYRLYVDEWVADLLETYRQAQEQWQEDLAVLRESAQRESDGWKEGQGTLPDPFRAAWKRRDKRCNGLQHKALSSRTRRSINRRTSATRRFTGSMTTAEGGMHGHTRKD